MSSVIQVQEVNSAGSPPRMSKEKLLQRLVAALATNHGVQPKQTEIWQRLKSLTPREVDVLCYVLGGQLNKEIAAELGIGEKTIKVHRGRVMEKLGVQSSGQLLAMVLRVVLVNKLLWRFRARVGLVTKSPPGSAQSEVPWCLHTTDS